MFVCVFCFFLFGIFQLYSWNQNLVIQCLIFVPFLILDERRIAAKRNCCLFCCITHENVYNDSQMIDNTVELVNRGGSNKTLAPTFSHLKSTSASAGRSELSPEPPAKSINNQVKTNSSQIDTAIDSSINSPNVDILNGNSNSTSKKSIIFSISFFLSNILAKLLAIRLARILIIVIFLGLFALIS